MADGFASERFNELIAQTARERAGWIDAVCRFALSRNSPYGVLVDCAGVRISKDVPAGELHYANQHCQYSDSWTISVAMPK